MSVQAVQYDCFGPVENLKLANVPEEVPGGGAGKDCGACGRPEPCGL